MKTLVLTIIALLTGMLVEAQTLNISSGSVIDQYPAESAGIMTYSGGSSLTILNKTYTLSDITKMYTDETTVTNNQVNIVYNGSEALVYVAGNVASYVNVTVNGAKVYINQTNTADVDGDEITYVLSGISTDGQFALDGSYKCTVSLNGVTLTNTNGAAISIGNKKRIQLSAKKGTVNTLADSANGSQKGCIYSKGQIQLQGNGTLNVAGNTAHAIKSGDYISIKNLTLNITKAVKDGISCNKYFLMTGGTVNISGVGDDGIQSDFETDNTTTGETTSHEDENSANLYLQDGILNVTVTANATKGIKAGGDLKISGGTITVKTTGGTLYDSSDADYKGCAGLKSDGNMVISDGTLTLTSSGTGGKCIKADGTLTISGGTINATSTGSNYGSSSGGWGGGSSSNSCSAKAIKVDGAMTVSGGIITAKASNHEAIETKSTLNVTDGVIYAYSKDDAINSASHMTISGGTIMAHSTGNDGLDANGNMYIKGGLVYAICSGTPEVALDANTEGGYKLYVQGGTIIALGGLEKGASLTQTCYSVGSSSSGGGGRPGGGGSSSGSWNKNTWYSMTVGSSTIAFKTPSSGGSGLVVSASSQPTMKSGVTVSNGTIFFDSQLYTGATISGGSSVTLSTYNNSSGGGGGWGW